MLHSPSFSADGRVSAARAENELFVWETDRGRRIGKAPIRGKPVVIELSSRGRYLAWLEENGRLAVLEPATSRLRVSVTTCEGTTLPVSRGPDCNLWVSVGWYPPVWLGRAG